MAFPTPDRWEWESDKEAPNRRKHGIGFNVAAKLFNDRYMLWRPDEHDDSDRFQALGRAEGSVLFVVYAWGDDDDDGRCGRIISARRATAKERRRYELGDFQ